jgi:hypothetical protein
MESRVDNAVKLYELIRASRETTEKLNEILRASLNSLTASELSAYAEKTVELDMRADE